MGTTSETKQVWAQKRRQRHHARAERRRRDRAVVPVAVAQRAGIRMATLAHATGQAGTRAALFEATYSLKSGQYRSGWFDVAALQPCELGSR